MGSETVGLKSGEKDMDLEKMEKGDPADYEVRYSDGRKEEASHGDVKNFQIDKTEVYCGLKKEDLLKYAKDPYWVRLRLIFLGIFVIVWVSMLVAAIVIIVLTPKCPPRPAQEWWETSVVYCIQPKSFMDSDGDGIGDLEGIHSKLDYIKGTVGAGAVGLGVIQKSPQKTMLGHDVSDHAAIWPVLGGDGDLENLRVAIHKKGMKLVLDMALGRSSDEHPWFKASRNRSLPFKDFYIWHHGLQQGSGEPLPPNDLTNAFGKPAWTFDKVRKEFYYHSYSEHEPDFNLTNPEVITKLDEVLVHWLKLKVDGIKILGAHNLVKDPSIFDAAGTKQPASLPESLKLVSHWRQLFENFTSSETQRSQMQPRALLVDVEGGSPYQTAYFVKEGGNETGLGAHLSINRQLLKLDSKCKAGCLSELVREWYDAIGSVSRHSNWMLSDWTSSRMESRFSAEGQQDEEETEDGDKMENVLQLLQLTLPGSTFVYYGDEIGMKDGSLSSLNLSLPVNSTKTFSFNPMQWDDSDFSGFTSSANPWVPVADDYLDVNVVSQTAHGSGMSRVKAFKMMTSLRKEPSIQWGSFEASHSRNIYFYLRRAEGHPSLLVAVNLGSTASILSPRKGKLGEHVPAMKATIASSTFNFKGLREKQFENGTEVDLQDPILLQSGEGVVLKWLEEKSIF